MATRRRFRLTTLIGEDVQTIPQSCLLRRPPGFSPASAVYLGESWVLTAGHTYPKKGKYSVVFAPNLSHAQPADQYDVIDRVKEPSADLLLLRIKHGPGLPALPFAHASEISTGTKVQLCAYGPNAKPYSIGVRRLSEPLPIKVSQNQQTFVAASNYPAVVLSGDSGGGALITGADDSFKLAGIIAASVDDHGQGSALCIALPPFFPWIKNTTGIDPAA